MAKSTLQTLAALVPALMVTAAQAAHAADAAPPAGLAVFDKQCMACHQAGGSGMAGLAPALAGALAPMLGSDDGRHYVAQVLIHGLSGRIVSQGHVFMGAMPSQSALSDAELADVTNYLARDLNGAKASVFSADDFVRARATKLTHKDLREMRERVLK
jgi:mono/diheme cytochrome c family protein